MNQKKMEGDKMSTDNEVITKDVQEVQKRDPRTLQIEIPAELMRKLSACAIGRHNLTMESSLGMFRKWCLTCGTGFDYAGCATQPEIRGLIEKFI